MNYPRIIEEIEALLGDIELGLAEFVDCDEVYAAELALDNTGKTLDDLYDTLKKVYG